MAHPTGYRITLTPTKVSQIVSPEAQPGGLSDQAVVLIVENLDGANAVDLGDQSVVTGQGYSLKANAVTPVIRLEPGQFLYAISANAVTLAVLESLI